MQRERKDFGQKQPEAQRSKGGRISYQLYKGPQGGSEAGLSLNPGEALFSKDLKDRKPSWDPRTHHTSKSNSS